MKFESGVFFYVGTIFLEVRGAPESSFTTKLLFVNFRKNSFGALGVESPHRGAIKQDEARQPEEDFASI